ncbi:MAG: hypothetical protein LBV29_03570, partial [Azoarcus sp.]|nr:hypothetical protein [Azoarcus sp.]
MKTLLIVLAATFSGLSLVACDTPETDAVCAKYVADLDPKTASECAKWAETASEGEIAAVLSKRTTHLLSEKKNTLVGISALFYGSDYGIGVRMVAIEYIVLKDEKTSQSVTYLPETDTQQAADFFFEDVWSPNGAYIVLPLSKWDGFAIFKSETVIQDIKSNNFVDTIRVSS